MQKIYYSTGNSPASFWTSTMEEVMLVIRGKTMDWRIHRTFVIGLATVIAGKGLDPLKDMPLPFDDDLTGAELSAEELYEIAKQTGYI